MFGLNNEPGNFSGSLLSYFWAVKFISAFIFGHFGMRLILNRETAQLLNLCLANFVFTYGGYDSGKNELAIEIGIYNEGNLDIFGTDDILKNWYYYPYAYFL